MIRTGLRSRLCKVLSPARTGLTRLMPLVAAAMMGDMAVADIGKPAFRFQKSSVVKLARHQPDLMALMSGTWSGAFNAQITNRKGSFTFSSRVDRNLWSQVRGSWGTDKSTKNEYGFGAIGMHTYVRPNLIIGGMVELDYHSKTTGTSNKESQGFMAGPYFLARMTNHPLRFEGRFLIGRTSSRLNSADTPEQRLDALRALAQLKMSGELTFGATKLTPVVEALYATDHQGEYTDASGAVIRAMGVHMGEVELGLDFERELPKIRDRIFTLLAGGGLSGTLTDGYGSADAAVPKSSSSRGRLNLGVSYRTQRGGTVVIDSFVERVSAKPAETYGLNVGFDISF